jgi:hypothetical protein
MLKMQVKQKNWNSRRTFARSHVETAQGIEILPHNGARYTSMP